MNASCEFRILFPSQACRVATLTKREPGACLAGQDARKQHSGGTGTPAAFQVSTPCYKHSAGTSQYNHRRQVYYHECDTGVIRKRSMLICVCLRHAAPCPHYGGASPAHGDALRCAGPVSLVVRDWLCYAVHRPLHGPPTYSRPATSR